jgi:hypothetical protein
MITRDTITQGTAPFISAARLQASVSPVHWDFAVITGQVGIIATANTAGEADTTGEAGIIGAVNIAAPGVLVGTAVGGTKPDDETLLSRLRTPVALRATKADCQHLALVVFGPR